MEFFLALPVRRFSQNAGQNARVNAACNPSAASLGWRPFVPGFIAPIIKRKFVNLPLRVKIPTLSPPPSTSLSGGWTFAINEQWKKKQVPMGIWCPLVLLSWMCVPVDLAPLESPLETEKGGLELNVLIGLLSEKPY